MFAFQNGIVAVNCGFFITTMYNHGVEFVRRTFGCLVGHLAFVSVRLR